MFAGRVFDTPGLKIEITQQNWEFLTYKWSLNYKIKKKIMRDFYNTLF